MRTPRFHPLSDMPLVETLRDLRGHPFYPSDDVLKALAPRGQRLRPEEAPCVVYHSPWGHFVVTEIDQKTLNGYGWACLASFPDGAEWGDLGYLGAVEKHRRMPWEYWERDLYSNDRTAAEAVARILQRYDLPAQHSAEEDGQSPQ
ncbi:MAG TPA: hypothetical protein VIU15_27825 [Streptomyces sp.]